MHRIAYLGLTLALLLALAAGCRTLPETGVSYDLARQRSAQIHDLRYRLHFDLTADRDAAVNATETITCTLDRKGGLVLDFREEPDHLLSLSINGNNIPVNIVNEHIIIPKKYTVTGENRVEITFLAGKQSLNQREEFLYTLLVPDRARTLFPCFDQPDLKARYTLSLSVPEDWVAVSNAPVAEEGSAADGRRRIAFAETEPLSTYLFSFVAGRFERDMATKGGRT
ncbi:MAG: aminopeptidase, partial [Bacteroidales bacterium]|nr:aminopeptidase [Bacteroidales bacterium]